MARALGQHRGAVYLKVLDGRKQPIRGLWLLGGRYYSRLVVLDAETGAKSVKRIPLEGVTTVAKATAAQLRLLTQRETNELPITKQTPKFADFADKYIASLLATPDSKRPGTIDKETVSLKMWKSHFGDLRLNHITKSRIRVPE